MRVLVSCDRIGRLGPAEASDVLAGAFQERGAQVAVAPMAGGGEDLAGAMARFEPEARLTTVGAVTELPTALAQRPDYLDVTALPPPSLEELLALPVADGRGVTVVVPDAEVGQRLTGLQGALAERGRQAGGDLTDILAADAAAEDWLARIGVEDEAPAGAMGGLGAWAIAQSARVASGLDLCIDGYRLREVAAKADLIVTGTDTLDFHHRGGEVVRRLTQVATQALTPVIVVAGRNFVSARELRLTGIEEAHAVASTGVGETSVGQVELRNLAARVATTWTW